MVEIPFSVIYFLMDHKPKNITWNELKEQVRTWNELDWMKNIPTKHVKSLGIKWNHP